MMINCQQMTITTDDSGNMVEEQVSHNMEPIPLGGYAGFWRRTVARLLDLSVHLVLTAFAWSLFFAAVVLFRPDLLDGDLAFRRLNEAITLHPIRALLCFHLTWLTYQMIAEMHGGGFGKLVTGLIVLREGAASPGAGNALIRNLTLPLEALSLGVIPHHAMEISEKRQRWGDRLGHTLVVCRATLPLSVLPHPFTLAGGLLWAVTCHLALSFSLMWSTAI